MVDDVAITAGAGTAIAADDVSSVFYQRIKLAAGADGTATDAVTTNVSATFNRPANTTAYAVNDAVADNVTAGSVTVMSWAITAGAGIVRRVRVRKSDQTVATPTIRVFLFSSSPTVGAGDNAAWANPLAACVGFVDVAVTQAGSDDAVGWSNADIPFAAATLYGLLQTTSIFTPASSETFTVDLTYIPG